MIEPAASVMDRLQRVRTDQVEDWQQGHGMPVESYLARDPGLADDVEALLELIYTEVVVREELGQHPSLEEYSQRFPHLAEALRRQFDVHALLADPGLAESTVDSAYAAASTAHADPRATPVPQPNLLPTQVLPADKHFSGSDSDRQAGPGVKRVAGYEILGELGHGGMGIVYKALQPGLRRVVALKMIGQGGISREGLARFRTEAEAVARLQHPNIVQVYEIGEQDGLPFLALEYVEGGSLAELLRGTPMPPRSAARLLVDLAQAMQHAHARGIIHRDLKPANILLQKRSADGGAGDNNKKGPQTGESDSTLTEALLAYSPSLIPKIADFGLARSLDAEQRQTRSGLIMGTPSYMPPEQAEGRHDQIGPTTDVYSLGAILYEILTGRPPFLAASTMDTLRLVISEEPVTPSRLARGTPRDLETICLKCLQKDPRQRYATPADLAADLERFLAGQPVHARRTPAWERALKWGRRHPAAAALLVAAIAVAIAGLGLWVEFTNRLRVETQNAQEQEKRAREAEQRAQGLKDDADKAAAGAQKSAAEAEKTRDQLEKVVRSQAVSVKWIAKTTRDAKISGKDPGEALFELACGYAETARKISQETDLPISLRNELGDQYAESAVYLLTCSDEKAGYFESPARRALLRDPRLKPLHGRKDFKDLLDRHQVTLP